VSRLICCDAECHYNDCHCADCRYAVSCLICCYAECHYADFRYAVSCLIYCFAESLCRVSRRPDYAVLLLGKNLKFEKLEKKFLQKKLMLQQDFKTCQKCRGDLIPNDKISYD